MSRPSSAPPVTARCALASTSSSHTQAVWSNSPLCLNFEVGPLFFLFLPPSCPLDLFQLDVCIYSSSDTVPLPAFVCWWSRCCGFQTKCSFITPPHSQAPRLQCQYNFVSLLFSVIHPPRFSTQINRSAGDFICFSIHAVLCIDHLWLKGGVWRADLEADPRTNVSRWTVKSEHCVQVCVRTVLEIGI